MYLKTIYGYYLYLLKLSIIKNTFRTQTKSKYFPTTVTAL